jgi:FkbM family methyltransferase
MVLLLFSCAWLAWGAMHPQYVAGLRLLAEGKTGVCGYMGTVSGLVVRPQQIEQERQNLEESRLMKRDGDEYELWKTPLGDWWMTAGSINEVSYGLSEQMRDIYSLGKLHVRGGDIVLDVGANIGVFTKKALALGASKVVAIEPVPANVECLKRNLQREIREGRVVVVEKGAWDKEDVLEMNIDAGNAAAHSFARQRGPQQTRQLLPLTTIDRIAADLGLPRVDFIKMDIEGAERRAVDGAKDVLKKFHPWLALSVYHLEDDPQVIPARVRAADATYRFKCGPCIPAEVPPKPEVFFFY